MKRSILLATVLCIAVSLKGQTTVNGYVYEDSNSNGKKERREKGVSQVAVSNGTDVVRR